jgi:CheY-like chemotaxis protein
MPSSSCPFAVRLIGFSTREADMFGAAFVIAEGAGYGYYLLEQENLQDPDLYIVNARQSTALVTLAGLRPSNVRPALLIGKPNIELPYPCVERPIDRASLIEALNDLVEKRADALARLEASDIVPVPERRSSNRVDKHLTNPAQRESLRARLPANGTVLVVDKNPVFRDYLSKLLLRQNVPALWTSDEMQALELCKQQPVALAMINTSTPIVDPYRLCWAIKEKETPEKTKVIFLIGKSFVYDMEQARRVGVDGFLYKPLARRQLISALKKMMPFLH